MDLVITLECELVGSAGPRTRNHETRSVFVYRALRQVAWLTDLVRRRGGRSLGCALYFVPQERWRCPMKICSARPRARRCRATRSAPSNPIEQAGAEGGAGPARSIRITGRSPPTWRREKTADDPSPRQRVHAPCPERADRLKKHPSQQRRTLSRSPGDYERYLAPIPCQ
jgi:hypothetical protein